MRDRFIPDTRIHCCLFFINPTGHTLKPVRGVLANVHPSSRIHLDVSIFTYAILTHPSSRPLQDGRLDRPPRRAVMHAVQANSTRSISSCSRSSQRWSTSCRSSPRRTR
jgi:septin 3/9/12